MRLNEFEYIAVKDAVSVQPAPEQFRSDIKASLASLVPMLEMLADEGGDAGSPHLDLSSGNNASDLTL